MKVKNKIFYNFVKQSYKKVSEVEEKEELYYKDHKLVVVVNDEEVGRRIYDIIKTLKEKNDEISAFDFKFMISKYFVEDEATIKIFSADITLDDGNFWSECTDKEKLKYMLAFIKSMEEKGYILDETKFDSQICDRISDFLTFFSVEENEAVKKDTLKMISYSDYLIVNNTNFGSKMALTEKNEEYSVYDGNIKIYHNMPDGFENFLQEQFGSLFISKEQIENLIIDFDFNVIGYKFENHETQGENKLSENHFESQYEIISFISKLDNFLDTAYSDSYRRFMQAKTFILEDNVICIGKNDSFAFQFNNIKGIYDFLTINPEEVNQQMVAVLFKLLLEYCNEKYGKMNRKRQLLRKNEIRYLPPYVSQEFVKYATGKKNEVDYERATDSFMEFLYYHKKILSSINELYYYDDRYVYSPENIPIIYDYELESEYGIRFRRNLNEELNNNIEIVTYSSPKATSKLKNTNKVKIIQNRVHNAENVKFTKISKIICGPEFSECEGESFPHWGYVVELPKGRKLTNTMLLSLDSKEIYRIMANWAKTFGIDCLFSVPLDTIWINDDYTFTINIWDKNFEIKELSSDGSFITSMVKHLIKIGYNPYVFEYNPYHRYADIISYIDETDSYCDEHKMYYKSSEGCPVCKVTKFFIPQDFKITSEALIYEDAYAKHYKIDESYSCNFKVYKKENVNMAEIEKCIDEIIAAYLTGQDLELKQDAFVPIKKLIDCNKQFIGYIYDPIEFDDNLISLLDITRLHNRARLMCLIKLVTNIRDILDNDLGFTQNPFGDAFINYTNKKIQILNIESIRKNANAEDTFRWTYDYVRKVISEDSHIPVDLSDCKSIKSILDKLVEISEEMTSRCSIHNIYYSASTILCPECAKRENLSNFKITKAQKDKIMNNDKIESGGESWIYAYDKRNAAKVFKEDPNINLNNKMIVISRILSRRDILEKANNDKNVKFNFVIPQEILVDDKPYGYIMEKVQNAHPISVIRYSDQREEIGFTMKDILELLIIIGQGLEYLHDKANIYIGDLNGANILFDEQKNVYFLDFDGVGIDEIEPAFVTPEYIDPISNKTGKITAKDDWYSYAVQAFCYLTFTHPFNGLYTVIKDGREVYMEISEKMEQRISLLGNHGMTPPDGTKSWDWMDEELINKFLSIFEGDYRESIVSDLIRQYDRLFKNEKNERYDNFIRVNSKMMAKQYIPFTGEIDNVLNQYCIISHNSKKQYVAVLFEEEGQIVQNKFNISRCKSINNVLLTKDRKTLYLYSDTRILGIDVETKNTIYKKAKLPEEDVVLDGNTLYIAKNSENKSYIIEVDIDSDGDGVQESKISVVPPEQQIKKMLVKFNSKFLFVKKGNKDFDEVFCNDEKLCNIPSRNMYNILFDSITNTWLVLNDKGNGIVITHEGKYKEFNIEEFVDSNNIDNVQFNKERIFIPTYDYLYIITVKSDQIIARKMECKKIMTPYSKLYDIGTDGFSVITDNTFYDVCKE